MYPSSLGTGPPTPTFTSVFINQSCKVMGMGFPEAQARQALEATGWVSVSEAVNALFG